MFIYTLLKNFLDPLVLILFLLAIGTVLSIMRNRKRSCATILFLSFAILYGVSIQPVSNFMCSVLEKDYITKSRMDTGKLDVVVVLGGGTLKNDNLDEDLPSQMTAARLLYAVQVFYKSGARYLLCSGKGDGRDTEAAIMAQGAQRLGVLKENIKTDPISRNTMEHAIEMNRRFNDKTIRIGLVTSAYHMKRSEREFRKYFKNVVPMPSDYLYSTSTGPFIFHLIPNTESLRKTSLVLSAIVGLSWYRMKNS
jgi:uncharacterized SAM-binding protein YcdF (DUF218 family)